MVKHIILWQLKDEYSDAEKADIKAGINFGIDTMLVYTGVSTRELVRKQEIAPTIELGSLDEWKVG